jgi:hypothetical protein
MRRCYKNASDDSHNTCVMKFLVCSMGFRFRWETSAHKKARSADPVSTRIFLLDSNLLCSLLGTRIHTREEGNLGTQEST